MTSNRLGWETGTVSRSSELTDARRAPSRYSYLKEMLIGWAPLCAAGTVCMLRVWERVAPAPSAL